MPSGYTAKLADGEQSFEDFVWGVARGFGALIEMRDAPLDAPIPEAFAASTYHLDAMNKAQADLASLQGVSDKALLDEQATERAAAVRRRDRYVTERREQAERYNRMLAKVRAWEPPTAEHENLKATMIQQLEESLQFDCGGSWTPEVPDELSAADYRAKERAKFERDIAYHAKHYAEDVERTAKRNEWTRALRGSLRAA